MCPSNEAIEEGEDLSFVVLFKDVCFDYSANEFKSRGDQ